MHSDPTLIYSDPTLIYIDPTLIYSDPPLIYRDPTLIYSDTTWLYSDPTLTYSDPLIKSLTLPPIRCFAAKKVWEAEICLSKNNLPRTGFVHGKPNIKKLLTQPSRAQSGLYVKLISCDRSGLFVKLEF